MNVKSECQGEATGRSGYLVNASVNGNYLPVWSVGARYGHRNFLSHTTLHVESVTKYSSYQTNICNLSGESVQWWDTQAAGGCSCGSPGT